MQTIKKELDLTNLNSNAFGYYIIYIAQIKMFPRDSIPPESQLAGSQTSDDSGSSDSNVVWVQVPSSTPEKWLKQ